MKIFKVTIQTMILSSVATLGFATDFTCNGWVNPDSFKGALNAMNEVYPLPPEEQVDYVYKCHVLNYAFNVCQNRPGGKAYTLDRDVPWYGKADYCCNQKPASCANSYNTLRDIVNPT